MNTRYISIEELEAFGPVNSLSHQAMALVKQQISTWPRAARNYASLADVEERILEVKDFPLTLQFNPERMRSTGAKTDCVSIEQRPCFLCEHSLPEEQKALTWGENYLILCNPFPIFPAHLTIPKTRHENQRIEPHFTDMLHLSRDLDSFTVFYNGPKCGASAPDHLHFQATENGYMPLLNQLARVLQQSHTLLKTELITVRSCSHYPAPFLVLESTSQPALVRVFHQIYRALPVPPGEEEPMLNLLCRYNGQWQVIVFPRSKQRPDQFYATDPEKVIMSPATVELAGIAILPRDTDFHRLTAPMLEDIYNQVSVQNDVWNKLMDKLTLELNV